MSARDSVLSSAFPRGLRRVAQLNQHVFDVPDVLGAKLLRIRIIREVVVAIGEAEAAGIERHDLDRRVPASCSTQVPNSIASVAARECIGPR
jgi:hypothetical protein